MRALTGPSQLDRSKVATLADSKDSIAFYDEIYRNVAAVLNPKTKPGPGMMVTKIFDVGGREFIQEEDVELESPTQSGAQESEEQQ